MQVRLQQQNTEPAVLSQEKAIQGSRQQNTERAVPLQARTEHRSMATETEPVMLEGACTESRLFGDRKQNRRCQSGSGHCRSVWCDRTQNQRCLCRSRHCKFASQLPATESDPLAESFSIGDAMDASRGQCVCWSCIDDNRVVPAQSHGL